MNSTISFRKSKAFISRRSVCTIAVDEGFGKIKRLDTSSETMISPWKTLEDLCCSRVGLLYFWVFSMFPLYRRSPTPADWITGQMTMDYRSSDSLSDRFSSRWSRVRNLIIYHLFLLSGKWYPTKKWLPRTSVLTCAIYKL